MSSLVCIILGLLFFNENAPQQTSNVKPRATTPAAEKQAAEKVGNRESSEPKSAENKAPVKEPALRKELLERAEASKQAANAFMKLMKEINPYNPAGPQQLSAENTAQMQQGQEAMLKTYGENETWLKQIVEKQGWPTITAVGNDGAEAAAMLAGFAKDVAFQQQCVALMSKLSKAENPKKGFAQLADRLLMAEGKKQRYGTLLFLNPDGKQGLLPIEDEANVDQRRAEIGLGTLQAELDEIKKKGGTVQRDLKMADAETVKDPDLLGELRKRIEAANTARKAFSDLYHELGPIKFNNPSLLDDATRARLDSVQAETTKTKAENIAWLKTIVKKHGWPTIELVGHEGSSAVYQLLLSANNDVAFQCECLELMKKLSDREVSRSNKANLIDEILLNEGKGQLYGTHLRITSDGNVEPLPIEDEANVDKRRAEFGLEPLKNEIENSHKSLPPRSQN